MDAAAKGESFIIAKAGRPMVKVTAVEAQKPTSRLGLCADQNWVIPEDFDRWAEDEIAEMFRVND